MNSWLDDFVISGMAKRIVLANYMSHLRLKNEGRETYSNVEDALQDFAQRTGLTEMQKRALRRQIFIKMAAALPSLDLKKDKMLFDTGNAPATILPGVKPGSDTAKALEKTRKKPFNKLTDLDQSSQQSNRDIEDNAQQKSPGSPDTDSVIDTPSQMASTNYRAGIVIEAVEENPWEKLEKKEEPPRFRFISPKTTRTPGSGAGGSKEAKILEEIRELQTQLVQRFMEPGGTIAKPKWKSLDISDRKLKIDIVSQINELRGDIADIRFKRQRKEQIESPKNKAAHNNVKFLHFINKGLGAKTDDDRKVGLQRLSPEGLQNLYDRVISVFGKDIYYRPSQGFDKERGDFVKCMVCDKYSKTWINQDNPGILPFSHLETHADQLLSGIDLMSAGAGKYREELIDAYLNQFPGAALQSREQELATFVEKLAEKASTQPLIQAPHVATQSEKKLTYTDSVLLDMVLHQFRRFGVDPDDKTLDDLAKEVLEEIKARLNEEFPDSLAERGPEGEIKFVQIGKLDDKNIPFEAFHRAFREEVGLVAEEYRGTFSDFKPSTRRHKRRWTGRERQEARQEWFKQLRKDDVAQQLATELGHWPNEQELTKRLHELDLIQVGISITGARGCWNCGNNELVIVPNKKVNIDSATCPQCGAYREVLVKVSEIDWEQTYVIRDVNENDPGGPKTYTIWEDPDYIGNGPKAVSNSRFVHILGREEQEIRTRITEPAREQEVPSTPIVLQVGNSIYSEQYGHGRVVYTEGSHTWAAWENPQYQRTAKLQNLKGEVVSLQSRDPQKSGYYKVADILIDYDNQSVMADLKSVSGVKATRQWDNLGVLQQDVPVATEVDPKDLQRVEYGSRRHDRQRIVCKLAQEKKNRYIVHTINRITKKVKPEITSRVDLLKQKIRRTKILKRLLRGVG